MTDASLPRAAFPASQLLARKRTHVRLAPDARGRAAIAGVLGLIELPELTFEGTIEPEGQGDLRLEGALVARAVQACVITLAPVPAQIRAHVLRRYLADWPEPETEESEIPEDVAIEPLPRVIDVAAVAIEELALALPDFPRAPGAVLDPAYAAEDPADDAPETAKPLAGLAALLKGKDGES
jgi:uncharacterized metal-binding protein YceD (DUF177 family)